MLVIIFILSFFMLFIFNYEFIIFYHVYLYFFSIFSFIYFLFFINKKIKNKNNSFYFLLFLSIIIFFWSLNKINFYPSFRLLGNLIIFFNKINNN